jgi:hypothetical protein
MVVTNTVETTAGSIFSFSSDQRMRTPDSPAFSELRIMAR